MKKLYNHDDSLYFDVNFNDFTEKIESLGFTGCCETIASERGYYATIYFNSTVFAIKHRDDQHSWLLVFDRSEVELKNFGVTRNVEMKYVPVKMSLVQRMVNGVKKWFQ